MSQFGAFTFVLHSHLPYADHAGRWPLGEEWSHEAATETYLPLLQALGDLATQGVECKVIGITPILAEQLAADLGNLQQAREDLLRFNPSLARDDDEDEEFEEDMEDEDFEDDDDYFEDDEDFDEDDEFFEDDEEFEDDEDFEDSLAEMQRGWWVNQPQMIELASDYLRFIEGTQRALHNHLNGNITGSRLSRN